MPTFWFIVDAQQVQFHLLLYWIHQVRELIKIYYQFFLVQIVTSITCQSNKRKRAISVDNLNEQKDGGLTSENVNEISKLFKKNNYLCIKLLK